MARTRAWDNLIDDFPREEQLAWNVDEHLGVGYHSYLLGTHEAIAANDPELVTAFVSATARGFAAAAADPAAIAPLYEKVLSYFPRELIAESAHLISDTWLHDGQWGTMRDELIAPYTRWMADHDIITDAEVWRPAITSQFLPSGGAGISALISVADAASLLTDPSADVIVVDATVQLASARHDGDHRALSGAEAWRDDRIAGSIHLDLDGEPPIPTVPCTSPCLTPRPWSRRWPPTASVGPRRSSRTTGVTSCGRPVSGGC
ncbi:ABC transporter substrate-binding protein [Aeromicrobium sp. UC242_57]|uniref:ABC transporter substrate-binding protein n=1 Tax=Aeromicrobium sp. UC242_57 TaxID=3374624 RepID=UPI0037A2DC18